MLKKDAIDHFGGQAELARALNIKTQSITDWGDCVPPLRQIQIEKITHGALKASPDVFGPAPTDAKAAA